MHRSVVVDTHDFRIISSITLLVSFAVGPYRRPKETYLTSFVHSAAYKMIKLTVTVIAFSPLQCATLTYVR